MCRAGAPFCTKHAWAGTPQVAYCSPSRLTLALPRCFSWDPYRPRSGALNLLIDSSGMKAEGDGASLAKKHGPSKPRGGRKVHLGINAETLEIRAIEITGSRIGDALVLPDLLDQIADGQGIGMVTADGADDTRACHAAIVARAAAAVIPPRKTGEPWKGQPRTTMSFAVATALAGISGSGEAATGDEVWSRQRCAASSYRGSASCLATSTGRSPSFRSEPQS